MASHDRAVTLVASPSYPNSIAWSKENLVAIASGHLITILNPALPVRPRGLVMLPPSNPFPIGVVERKDLHTSCLTPFCLSRDVRPCARSISWSPPGFAANSGCLLAVCTTEGRVKLYRAPFCEFSPEWIEVVDISDMLYHYLESINFGEMTAPSMTSHQELANAGCIREGGSIYELQDSVSRMRPKRIVKLSRRRVEGNKYVESLAEELPNLGDTDILLQSAYDGIDDVAASRGKEKIITGTKVAINPCSSVKNGSFAKRFAEVPERADNDVLPVISASQYASRSTLLSSLIVAWSPVLQFSGVSNVKFFANNCAILAVGGKSGNISFWRIYEPQCYTIEHGRVPVDPVLIGVLQAHNSWITAISWAVCAAGSTESQLVLATGSCDGSARIWLGNIEQLIKTSETNAASFSLLREVITAIPIPVSTLSLVVPVRSLDKVVLAIGRGSGSLEVWFCHISINELQNAGVYNAHNQVVTGLAWAFDGCCLYSCSQDNFVCNWILHRSSLYEISFPLEFPGSKNSAKLSPITDLCFGLALSPGDIMVAVVHSLDSDLLNQMYQARTQKALIEFYWASRGSPKNPWGKNLNDGIETSDLLDRGLQCWESTILCALNYYDNVDIPLVPWDVVTALDTCKKIDSSFMKNMLIKWISKWLLSFQSSDSLEKILCNVQSMLSNMSTRRMHLLNIICTRLMLSDDTTSTYHREQHKLGVLSSDEGRHDIWIKLLVNIERELQERYVSFSLKNALSCASCSSTTASISTNWSPVGIAQMEQWISIKPSLVRDQLKHLGQKIEELGSRIHSICEYVKEERCSFCSALVPFESPEAARCEGITHPDGSRETHELKRCAVSMQLHSVTDPMWFCICCQRSANKLPPKSFFTMPESPFDVDYESRTFALQQRAVPFCIFCGILLQRHLPDFLLSASLV